MPDLTKSVDKYTVLFRLGFDVRNMFNEHEWFMRDGRFQGIAANFVLTPKACHDLWTPFSMPLDEAKRYTKREFILDELCISLNMSRYGLKYTGLAEPIYKMIDHFGNETETPEQRAADAERAKTQFFDWGFPE